MKCNSNYSAGSKMLRQTCDGDIQMTQVWETFVGDET